ncbi:MAG TPA: type II secretion system protein [Exilispira sp.]|nr:type II secretion system protein [Exilispira sp.]HPP05138.1 type II secretion system protein [Spirochaetota bacterium]
MKKLFGKKGFTLIEIVIVIVLLAILAAVAYPKYLDLRDDAHKSADQAVIGSWRAGVHIYFAKYKKFPDTEASLKGCLEDGMPTGWTIKTETNDENGDSDIDDYVITCNGLPTDSTKTQSWVYVIEDGSFITLTGGH